MKRNLRAAALLLAALLCMLAPAALAEAVLTLPEGLTVIEEETFYGAQALGEVVVPEGVEEIRSKAFADSSVEAIILPESISYIADDAFDGCASVSVAASEGSYAYEWAVEKGYIEGNEPEPTDPEDFTYEAIDDETCRVTGYTGSETEIVIPSVSPEGLRVVEIGYRAFSDHINLVEITIGDGIEEIPAYTFYGCTSLKKVNLPEGLITIREYAFENCTSMESIHLPDSIERMYYRVFEGCTKLSEVNYPTNWREKCKVDNGSSIYDYDSPFYGCSSLTRIEIPEGVTEIPDYAFSGCSALTEIVLPDTLTMIGAGAFIDCGALTEIVLPDTLITIGAEAFSGCSGIKRVELPNSVISVGKNAFKNCTGLTHIALSSAMEIVESYIFEGCSNLTDVTLPEGLITIREFAFRNCTNLESIYLPDSIERMYYRVFENCTKLSEVNYPANWKEKCKVDNGSSIYDHDSPFYGCSSLTRIEIPEGVTEIPDYAFSGCSALTEIVLPDTLTTIGVGAFIGCSELRYVELPNSVTSVGKIAFRNCTGLTRIVLSSAMEIVESYIFEGCSSLTDVTLPEGLITIREYAFLHCTSLENIHLPDSVERMYYRVFDGCTKLSEVNYPTSWKEKCKVDSGSSIYDYDSPFYGCSSLTSITIPDGVNEIPEYAFMGCTGLLKVFIPESVTMIGDNSFNDCSDELTIYGFSGSYAEEFAVATGIQFVPAASPELTLESTATGSRLGDKITTTVSVSEGASPYKYSYALLCDGVVVRRNTGSSSNKCSFVIREAGTYYVSVTVTDCIGAETTVTGTTYTFDNGEYVEVTGSVNTADGIGLSDVGVSLINKAGERFYATTGFNGTWKIKCPANDTYEVQYYKYGYLIAHDVTEIELSNETNIGAAIATVYTDTEEASGVQFTMSAAEVETGIPVVFTVTAENAITVRLVADGKVYDAYGVVDGVCQFERVFTKAGTRSIQILTIDENEDEQLSAAQTLVVSADTRLNEPVLQENWTTTAGVDLLLDWEPVENADEYVAYLYCEERFVWKGSTTADWITIPGSQFYQEGDYSLDLLVTGAGFDQSSSGAVISVDMPIEMGMMSSKFETDNGEPISGVEIKLIKLFDGGFELAEEIVSDEQGAWAVNELIPGCNYQILYFRDGYEFTDDRYDFTAVCGNNKFTMTVGTSLGHGSLYLSEKGLHHWKESNSQTVTVFAPTSWTATTDADWLAIAQNENLLTVSMTENTTGKVRNAVIKVTSGEYQVTLEIVQEEGENLALRDLESDGTGKLSKKKAADILNFIGGVNTVKWHLFVGYKPHADVEDYWRLLIGDTKGWSEDLIEITGKSFANWAKVRLTLYASFVSDEELNIRTNELIQYASEKLDIENILKDGAEDHIKEVVGADKTDWMDAEDIRAYTNAISSLISLSRANGSAYVLNRMVQLSNADRYEKMYMNAVTTWNTSICLEKKTNLDSYAEIILQYD